MALERDEEATLEPFEDDERDATCEKVKEKDDDIPRSVPAVVLYHVGQLDDVLPLLVLLTQLEGLFIFPAQCGVTVFTVDVGDCVKSREQQPLLRRTAANVHHRVEEIGSALAALERLGDQIVMVGQVGAAVHAAVTTMAGVQVGLERLRFSQLHHV